VRVRDSGFGLCEERDRDDMKGREIILLRPRFKMPRLNDRPCIWIFVVIFAGYFYLINSAAKKEMSPTRIRIPAVGLFCIPSEVVVVVLFAETVLGFVCFVDVELEPVVELGFELELEPEPVVRGVLIEVMIPELVPVVSIEVAVAFAVTAIVVVLPSGILQH